MPFRLNIYVFEKFEYLYFDTGVMYRSVTWLALDKGVPIEDEDGVTKLAENCEIDIRPASKNDGRDNDVLVDGINITWGIRSPQPLFRARRLKRLSL